jgi:hypothetical protein
MPSQYIFSVIYICLVSIVIVFIMRVLNNYHTLGIEAHHCVQPDEKDPKPQNRVHALCSQDESSVVLNQIAAKDANGELFLY